MVSSIPPSLPLLILDTLRLCLHRVCVLIALSSVCLLACLSACFAFPGFADDDSKADRLPVCVR
jgi:hypothetical protein